MGTKIEPQDWPTCQKCGHYDITGYGYGHAELCEYFEFRDIIAPKIKWSLIPNSISRYVKVVFEVCDIEHRAWEVSSYSGGYMELFTPDHIAAAVTMFYSTEDAYGGMDLAEYLKAVTGAC